MEVGLKNSKPGLARGRLTRASQVAIQGCKGIERVADNFANS